MEDIMTYVFHMTFKYYWYIYACSNCVIGFILSHTCCKHMALHRFDVSIYCCVCPINCWKILQQTFIEAGSELAGCSHMCSSWLTVIPYTYACCMCCIYQYHWKQKYLEIWEKVISDFWAANSVAYSNFLTGRLRTS